MIKKISFKNNRGQTLRGYVHYPKKEQYNGTAIVVLHGFPSTGYGKFVSRTARDFLKLGCLVLRFSFSGSPDSDGKFEDKLMSQEVSEIKNVIDFLEHNYEFKRLILIGHSTGAIDASLYAYKDKRIDKLVLSGTESNLKQGVNYEFTGEMIRDFWRKGYVIYNWKKRNGKRHWVTRKKLKKAFYDEFFVLDIPKAMKKWKKPLLIIHGEKDEAIPSEKDPIELYKLCKCKKRLVIIKDSDHSYKKRKYWKQFVDSVWKFIRN